MIKPEIIEKAIVLISKRYVNYEYFFNKLESPEWIIPLSQKGMFKKPPSNIVTTDGKYIQFPVWPESRYLARMASKAAELVFKTTYNIPDTNNVHVHEDIVDIALAIPTELSIQLLPRIKNWIKSPYSWLLIEKTGKLIVHLAKGNKVKQAIELADILIDILPDPQWEEKSKSESSVLTFKPHAWFDDWIYEQILTKDIPILVENGKLEVLKLLCEKLAKAVKFSTHKSEINTPDDRSYIWRPSIESDYNLFEGVRDLLITAVRNACESLIEAEGKEVLNIVESYHYYIFKRIGLYLRRKYFNIDPEGTNKLVIAPDVFDNVTLHYEYFHLLKEHYNKLSPETQENYLKLVRDGKDFSDIVKLDGSKYTDDEKKKLSRLWQYKKLIPIQEYLKNSWKEYFEKFKSEFDEIEQPDKPFRIGAWRTGPTSIKSQDELQTMKDDELIDFLKSWQPKDDWDEPEPEGLSRELTSLIKSAPDRFAIIADKFIGLDPTYISGIIRGFNDACREKMSFVWDKILALCNWVVFQPREIPNRIKYRHLQADPDWGWSRKTIASLLSTALNANAISFEYKDRVWTILKPLTDDPDPEPNKETTLEPYTLAINTVRGEAMNATIEYALWVIRNTKKFSDTQKNIYSFKDMPEVQSILDKHLDINQEPSLAVRSVYGRWFPWLVLLDSQWAKNNKDRIFPKEQEKSDFYNAAWNTYIIFCPAYDNVFDILKDEYKLAIERIGTKEKTPGIIRDIDERLAEHLAVFHWRGKLNINDSNGLLELFYEKVSEKLLARIIWYIGNVLYNEKETIPSDILERLKAFWKWRNQDRKKPISNTERKEFGLWFASGKFDDEWAIKQLKDVLNNVGDINLSHKVSEYILKITNKMPLDVIE
ncbi:MAG: hypothetical protein ABIK31_06490, partial [candidate division WOR-3 bacterium]